MFEFVYSRLKNRAQVCLLAAGCLSSACGADERLSWNDAHPGQLSWEEFERESRVESEHGTYYVVEHDIPILSKAELRSYYDDLLAGVDKGVVHLHNGADDVWRNGDQLSLRYCVDDNLDNAPVGVSMATMVDAMRKATAAWSAVANIYFQYDSAKNSDCEVGSSVPDTRYFKVSRLDSLGAPCAFGPQSRAAWTCLGLDGSTIGILSSYQYPGQPTTDWPGVMMHEVGHALGLHHEQYHTNGGGCPVGGVRDVTTGVDLGSIMGYPFGSDGCALTTPSLTKLSELDGWSARTFYGMPAAWYVGIVL